MRIGELSELTGASARSLRYYEQQGLLQSHRSAGGQREYDERAVARVKRIRQLISAGMNSESIYRVLPCMRDEDGKPAEHADQQLTIDLLAERDRLKSKIDDLQSSMDSLDQIIKDAALPKNN